MSDTDQDCCWQCGGTAWVEDEDTENKWWCKPCAYAEHLAAGGEESDPDSDESD
jgi:hypothetical protein